MIIIGVKTRAQNRNQFERRHSPRLQEKSKSQSPVVQKEKRPAEEVKIKNKPKKNAKKAKCMQLQKYLCA